MTNPRPQPGFTPAALAAGLLGMLAMGVLIQFSDIVVGITFASEHTLALPAVWTLVALLALVAGAARLGRGGLLTRTELLCVLYGMLIAAPLMTQGFWHRAVAILSTAPRLADFDKLDAIHDGLWPHGPNLAAEILDPGRAGVTTAGEVRWETVTDDAGRAVRAPVLVGNAPGAWASLRVQLPVSRAGSPGVIPGRPHLVSVLAHATALGPAAHYDLRLHAGDGPRFQECFSSVAPARTNLQHRAGFRRVGAYGVTPPPGAQTHYTLEFSLSGEGRIVLLAPKLFDVSALEDAFRGRTLVSETEYAALPADARGSVVVKPDRLLSRRGLAFLLAGYIPLDAWRGPVVAWTTLVLLVLGATLAVGLIMRRQWFDSERFAMPVARIPAALLSGSVEDADPRPSIWRNRAMQAGFALGLAWLLLKAWHFYNPHVPDLTVKINLQDYFRDPSWGQMFAKWRFEVDGIFLALCGFMELNVLLSLVLGYGLYRAQFWAGELSGRAVNPEFPHADAQLFGGYVGYGLALLALGRRQLWQAIAGPDAVGGRAALATLLACAGGALVWAKIFGLALSGMAVFFASLVLVGFVAARIRAECGTPWGYFAPANLALGLGLLGGVTTFGPEAAIFAMLASFMFAPTVFFLIPGAQAELLGLGRRWHVPTRHLVAWALVGVLGGMLIGGWVFLSNAYALGGDTSHYRWAFDPKWWYFHPYEQDLAAANAQLAGAAPDTGAGGDRIAFAAAGAVAAVLAWLRQAVASFWFHPVGFVLGSSDFMNYVWGSALTAWVIRATVLRLGGATAVRERLQPFFIGVFLGTAAGYCILMLHGAVLRAQGVNNLYPILTS